MSQRLGPRYRLPVGRKPGDRSVDPGGATRMYTMRFPLDLFQILVDDCAEQDVAWAVSGIMPANVSDYIRASVFLTHALLSGPTRERVLAFLALPEDRLDTVLAHLGFRYGARWDREHPPQRHHEMAAAVADEAEMEELIKEQEGIVAIPEDEAPLTERDPWNQL